MRFFLFTLLLATTLSSCPSTPACSPDTCTGCCDATDECRVSTTLYCGAGANVCSSCRLGEDCVNGFCTPIIFTGGGGGEQPDAGTGGGDATGGGSATGGGETGGGTAATGGGIATGGGAPTGGGASTGGGSPSTGGGTATGGGSATGGGTAIPDAGAILNVGCWNLDWFADPDGGALGPTNNALQQQNVQTVLQTRSDIDLWGIEEIVGVTEFNQVVDNLNGFDSVVVTEVPFGASYYFAEEQKVGVVWRTSKLTKLGASVILRGSSYDFGGRPPLEVQFRYSFNGVTKDFFLIVMHMKAYGDQDSYNRRVAASQALKTYLDTNRANQSVMVVGDWNDDLDSSTYMNSTTPYANFLSDTADYKFPTYELTQAHKRTTASSSNAIDHQMITAPLFPYYVTGSAAATVPSISNYSRTTSDHYPVTTKHVLR